MIQQIFLARFGERIQTGLIGGDDLIHGFAGFQAFQDSGVSQDLVEITGVESQPVAVKLFYRGQNIQCRGNGLIFVAVDNMDLAAAAELVLEF